MSKTCPTVRKLKLGPREPNPLSADCPFKPSSPASCSWPSPNENGRGASKGADCDVEVAWKPAQSGFFVLLALRVRARVGDQHASAAHVRLRRRTDASGSLRAFQMFSSGYGRRS